MTMDNCRRFIGIGFAGFFVILVGLMIVAVVPASAEELAVVATTSWTAAYCRAAGIENVTVLAPATMLHPPDYLLKPSDIPLIGDADIIVVGGYEAMVDRIRSHLAGTETEIFRIETGYALESIESSVTALAVKAGTLDVAKRNLMGIRTAYDRGRRVVEENGLNGRRAWAHRFQAPLAAALGLQVVGTFGPIPPGPQAIAEAAEARAEVIIDNAHNPVSGPLSEVSPDSLQVTWINFPGLDGTTSLEEVILANAQRLAEAFR